MLWDKKVVLNQKRMRRLDFESTSFDFLGWCDELVTFTDEVSGTYGELTPVVKLPTQDFKNMLDFLRFTTTHINISKNMVSIDICGVLFTRHPEVDNSYDLEIILKRHFYRKTPDMTISGLVTF